MKYTKVISKWGNMVGAFNDLDQLTGLWFEGQKYFPLIADNADWLSKEEPCYLELQKQLQDYEKGLLKSFHMEIAPKGTAFQETIWKLLQEIPYSETITYGEMSKRAANILGRETMSAQAVGGAIGRNPISLIIPCHRVVGANGNLTGYAGGLDKKSALLIHESQS